MDMKTFAAKVTALGAKPGLWYRPMRAWEEAPDSLKLAGDKRYFDPTVPEVKKRIAQELGISLRTLYRRLEAHGLK